MALLLTDLEKDFPKSLEKSLSSAILFQWWQLEQTAPPTNDRMCVMTKNTVFESLSASSKS